MYSIFPSTSANSVFTIDYKKIKCLVFNGWLFENYEDAKTAILGTILDEFSKETHLTKKAQEIIKGLYKSVDKFKLL